MKYFMKKEKRCHGNSDLTTFSYLQQIFNILSVEIHEIGLKSYRYSSKTNIFVGCFQKCIH